MSAGPADHWGKADRDRLTKLYLASSWADLLAAFPGRSRHGIYRAASGMNLKRGPITRIADGHPSTDPVMVALRARRIALGFSQEELAGVMGFSTACIQRCEHGRSQPRYFMLRVWCEALGMAVSVAPSGNRPRMPKAVPRVQAQFASAVA